MDGTADHTRTVRGLQIICGGLAGGIVFYGVVGAVLAATGTFTQLNVVPASLLPFIWLGTLPVAVLARTVATRLSQPKDGESPLDFAQRWASSVIVGMALREGVALMGVTLSMLSSSMVWVGVFAATGVAFMVFEWPQEHHLTERL